MSPVWDGKTRALQSLKCLRASYLGELLPLLHNHHPFPSSQRGIVTQLNLWPLWEFDPSETKRNTWQQFQWDRPSMSWECFFSMAGPPSNPPKKAGHFGCKTFLVDYRREHKCEGMPFAGSDHQWIKLVTSLPLKKRRQVVIVITQSNVDCLKSLFQVPYTRQVQLHAARHTHTTSPFSHKMLRWWHYITQMDSMSLWGLWGVLPDLHNSLKSCWALVDCTPVVSHMVAGGALCCALNFQAGFGWNSSSGFLDALICCLCRWVCVLRRIAPSLVLIMYALWGSFWVMTAGNHKFWWMLNQDTFWPTYRRASSHPFAPVFWFSDFLSRQSQIPSVFGLLSWILQGIVVLSLHWFSISAGDGKCASTGVALTFSSVRNGSCPLAFAFWRVHFAILTMASAKPFDCG